MVRALSALSHQRNRSAAALIDQLLADHPDTLLVRTLR
jgi:hypothetical protein